MVLRDIRPLVPVDDDPDGLGAGRWGRLATPLSLDEVSTNLKQFLRVDGLHAVGDPTKTIHRIAGLSSDPFLTKAKVDLFTREDVFDTSKARDLLGFVPELSLADGLRDAISWWRANDPSFEQEGKAATDP